MGCTKPIHIRTRKVEKSFSNRSLASMGKGNFHFNNNRAIKECNEVTMKDEEKIATIKTKKY